MYRSAFDEEEISDRTANPMGTLFQSIVNPLNNQPDNRKETEEEEEKEEEKKKEEEKTKQEEEEKEKEQKKKEAEPPEDSEEEDEEEEEEKPKNGKDAAPVLFQPNESEAKRLIAQDVLNDEFEEIHRILNFSKTVFTFPDETIDRKNYLLDYSLSHPFENECRFPIPDREEKDLSKNVRHYRRVNCPKRKEDFELIVSQLPTGELLAGSPHRSAIRGGVVCKGREITGTLRSQRRKLMQRGNWFEIPLHRRVFVNYDQFIVQCTDRMGKIVFHDVFASLTEKPRLSPPRLDSSTTRLSVDIFVIDSTARNQFFRHMPLTLKVMRRMGFKFMFGHTKVGDNSAINLLPLLSGKVYDATSRGLGDRVPKEIILSSAQIKEDFWRYADMLIQIARDRGCATLWNDDIANVGYGLFHYYAFPGFLSTPADYYYRPFYTYLYGKMNAGSSCVNGEFVVPKYIHIWERFARRFAQHCHFSFNFMTGLTHASSSNLELYDEHMAATLDRLDRDGAFENSMMVLMGDHGQRISSIQTKYTGRIEERMPLVSIHLPKRFREAFPEKMKNLEVNQNRLTSNFDLHETIREVMELPSANRTVVGRSFFGEIPLDRDCKDARVPENFCMCQDQLNDGDLPPNAKEPIFGIVAAHVNSSLSSLQCVKSHNLSQPDLFTPFTISVKARKGIRYPKEWDLFLAKKHFREPKTRDNEFFDVELRPQLNVDLGDGKNAKSQLIARVLWNRLDKTGHITAEPLLNDRPCDVTILADICKCLR